MSTVGSGSVPFGATCIPRSLGDGTFTADLPQEWTVAGHPHGGFLLALLTRTAVSALAERGEEPTDPLVTSAEFLRPPAIGPVMVHTDIRKIGRRGTVVSVRLEQRARSCVEARVTLGRFPARPPIWSEPPGQQVAPPSTAVPLSGQTLAGSFRLAQECDVRLDRDTAGFLFGRSNAPPRLRLWVRPRNERVDPYFALLAGDINPPVVFNLGRFGWSPTAQLTAFLRGEPAAGWLRVAVEGRLVQEDWFDSDATVFDARGRIVCQARQLALIATGQ